MSGLSHPMATPAALSSSGRAARALSRQRCSHSALGCCLFDGRPGSGQPQASTSAMGSWLENLSRTTASRGTSLHALPRCGSDALASPSGRYAETSSWAASSAAGWRRGKATIACAQLTSGSGSADVDTDWKQKRVRWKRGQEAANRPRQHRKIEQFVKQPQALVVRGEVQSHPTRSKEPTLGANSQFDESQQRSAGGPVPPPPPPTRSPQSRQQTIAPVSSEAQQGVPDGASAGKDFCPIPKLFPLTRARTHRVTDPYCHQQPCPQGYLVDSIVQAQCGLRQNYKPSTAAAAPHQQQQERAGQCEESSDTAWARTAPAISAWEPKARPVGAAGSEEAGPSESAVSATQTVASAPLIESAAATEATEEKEEEEEGALVAADGRPLFPGADYDELEATSTLLQDVHIVKDRREAERVASLLTGKFRNYFFACDTEVAYIDVKSESPVGHGKVICFSIFGGDSLHFAEGSPIDDKPVKSRLWVDTFGIEDESEVEGVMDAFKPFFADPKIKKVWHNFSFDRHVLNNHGVDCQGLHGDTIHMARMYDASRLQGGGPGYSLEALSSDPSVMRVPASELESKTSMKELFQEPVIKKDGTEGKLKVMPSVEVLQLDPRKRAKWIHYSTLDAKATYDLFHALGVLDLVRCQRCPGDVQHHLANMKCHPNGFTLPDKVTNMLELYLTYWLPFGQLLTDMETAGVLVNREHLAEAEVRAVEDQERARARFKAWAGQRVPDAALMNVSSGTQVRQLFFAGMKNEKSDETCEMERTFKIPNEDPDYIEEGKKRWKKTRDILLYGVFGRNVSSPLKPEHYTPSGWPATGTPALRLLAGKSMAAIKALEQMGIKEPSEVTPLESFDEEQFEDLPPLHVPTIAETVASALETKKLDAEAAAKGYGQLYSAFGGGVEGLEACAAADALVEINAIDTLLSNFIVPLQGDAISTPDHRVHCSLNINTETGRLSARRPNLQNQPALEKDRYKIRKAFTANVAEGKTLIVADYGQLELRLLAHMANCTSMLEAFELGGDFHSRTALGMYDHIKEAVARKDCLLEWDYPDGAPPPVPLVKDMFGSERRKAKVLNFSIAYGKTAHGLMKDFGTNLSEAQATVEKWYADRYQVKDWQKEQRDWAMRHGYVTTLLGRRRVLPGINDSDRGKQGHAMRAAINTPIQGSAADVATAAMISIDRCQELKDLGWVLLLQVHDEVILEGPEESAVRAQELVVQCMEKPFDGENPLMVELSVDSNIATTWYEAK